ncbi:MAG: hypothetical protein L0H41_14995 [Microlunatus sp.]|nr:hypothetical protein [Microlunatus sp.]
MSVLKLAPHIHTEASDDSDWPLRRLASTLKWWGFDGMLVSDHDRTMDGSKWRRLQAECDRVGDETGFLIVPGVEYQDPDHVVHVPVFGRMPFQGRSPDIMSLMRSAREQGSVAVFAHPARRNAWQRWSPKWAAHLSGIEVWNRKYDGIAPNAWALDTAREHDLMPMVGLDWHGPRQLFGLALEVPAPAAATNRARSDAVLAVVLTGRARCTAFSVGVERFADGFLGDLTRRAERTRAWLAPRVRRLEALVGRGPIP